jgi:mRNA-degrading endonuclease toxin of MazEF toxin-antitoxin module
MSAMQWVLIGLVALGAVAAVVVLRRRRGPTRGRPVTPVPPPRPGWRGRPAPGEIWWADVPYQDGEGSKIRPCLVLRTGAGGSAVLKITSQDQRTRDRHLRLPTAGWDARADHDSWLDLRSTYQLSVAAFRRRAGVVDTRSWRAVRRAHPTGWTT